MAEQKQDQQQQQRQYQPRFKSEVYVPIRQDSHSFEERQKTIWDEMHERMERRRKEWEEEVTRMRKDFFRLKPEEMQRGSAGGGGSSSSDDPHEKMDLKNMFYDVKDGAKVFRVSFDVSQFQPEEISVKTHEQQLIVNAKHEEKETGKTVSREFSRQVDIPQNVDPQKLRSTLSKDGILQIEAQVSGPTAPHRRTQEHRVPFSFTSTTPQSFPNSNPNSSPNLSSTPNFQTVFDCGPSVTERDGSRTFRIAVDVGPEFEPGDLTIKTVDRKLTVNARHEERTPGRTSCKEFSREFDLPEGVDPNLVTAGMTGEGRLLLEAPMAAYAKGVYTGKPGCAKQPTVTVSLGPVRGADQ